ncbi:MAG: class I SAM-dependent methyltransferase [Burkholderiales bacterium]
MLPVGDKTPQGWELPRTEPSERIKRLIRKLVYPAYLKLINPVLQKRFDPENRLDADQWFWGHRGLEYGLLRKNLDRIADIRGKHILIAGCGTGRDIPSWMDYRPKQVVGVDYFSYDRAWAALCSQYSSAATLGFVQGDLGDFREMPSASFDLIGSDAVFEHLKNLPEVLEEFYRLLKDDGVIYATFGPLWYSWGGDHVSGYDEIRNGYNHVILSPENYQRYLDAYGEFSHSEDDGRTWVEHDLFSYLRPAEYLSALEAAGFKKMYLGVVIDPRAVRCLQEHPNIGQLLPNGDKLDWLVTGMTVVYRKLPA